MRSLHLPDRGAFVRWHEIAGEGPPLVCLPGLGFPAVANFLGVVTHPAMRGRAALMIDLLGHGASDRPPEPCRTMEAHADCVAAVLDHVAAGPVPVLGHSLGGTVALTLALRRPDLVSRLVLSEANLTPGGGAASRRIAAGTAEDFAARALPRLLRSRREAAIAGDAGAAFILGAWAQADPRALHADATALVNLPADLMARSLALDLPRAFLYGELSHPDATGAPGPDAPDPAPLLANGVAVEVIPGVGHELMRGNLDGFVAALRRSLGDDAA